VNSRKTITCEGRQLMVYRGISQVIFHPVVLQGLKFGGTTVGRDKVYRALQYFARFYAWHLANKGDKLEALRWVALKGHLGTARKCKPSLLTWTKKPIIMASK